MGAYSRRADCPSPSTGIPQTCLIFLDYSMENRTYRYFQGEAPVSLRLRPFYTSFAYSDLKLNKEELSAGESLFAEVTVTNTGARDGDEVLECYLRDEEASVSTPKWSLCDFNGST